MQNYPRFFIIEFSSYFKMNIYSVIVGYLTFKEYKEYTTLCSPYYQDFQDFQDGNFQDENHFLLINYGFRSREQL